MNPEAMIIGGMLCAKDEPMPTPKTETESPPKPRDEYSTRQLIFEFAIFMLISYLILMFLGLI